MALSRRFASLSMRGLSLALVVFPLVLGSGCKPRRAASDVQSTSGGGAGEFQGKGAYPIWAYDGGPDLNNEMGRELVELHASIPSFPEISDAVYGDQMFRPAFGPIPWRMLQKANSVKILFIGQDGTHIAEAAGRPATAGFGGRAQDLAKHFGVSSSAAFINTYAFTIRWQYGAFDTPLVSLDRNGKPSFSFTGATGTPVWLISQDLESPIVKWRNRLIDWIIRNNRESLKLIVTFGGGARDAMGTYVESKGAKVGTRLSAQTLIAQKTRIPEFDLLGAGSNKQAATPVTPQGKDLVAEFARENGINFSEALYKATDKKPLEEVRKKFMAAYAADPEKYNKRMVLPPGPQNNTLVGTGLVHPAQIGGYDTKRMSIGGRDKTSSLLGLKITEDFTVDHDILVVQLPHPTALSMGSPADASKKVNAGLDDIRANMPAGWEIAPDSDAIDPDTNAPLVNRFAANEPYKYGRADMGTEYYDFGAPNSRMVNVSSASRDGANTIVFGTRQKVSFDETLKNQMTSKFCPSAWNGDCRPGNNKQFPFNDEMWIMRGTKTDGTTNRSELNRRYTWDAGPGEEMAKIMKTNLPRNPTFTAQESGEGGSSSINGDFAHYRGTFQNPEVLILADPDGEDDLITARALTGTRGQFLNGLMSDLGVADRYLVIKTAPYSMTGTDWATALAQTNAYREAVLKKIFESGTPKVVLTDGDSATSEFARIFPSAPEGLTVIAVKRQGNANNSGIIEAGQAMVATGKFTGTAMGKMKDIPRSHLSYYARVWEGTSGDRVLTAGGNYAGKAFGEVAPKWAYSQNFAMVASDVAGCEALIAKVNQSRTRLGQAGRGAETVMAYATRMKANGNVDPKKVCGKSAVDAGEGSSNQAAAVESMEVPAPEDDYGVDDKSDVAVYDNFLQE